MEARGATEVNGRALTVLKLALLYFELTVVQANNTLCFICLEVAPGITQHLMVSLCDVSFQFSSVTEEAVMILSSMQMMFFKMQSLVHDCNDRYCYHHALRCR